MKKLAWAALLVGVLQQGCRDDAPGDAATAGAAGVAGEPAAGAAGEPPIAAQGGQAGSDGTSGGAGGAEREPAGGGGQGDAAQGGRTDEAGAPSAGGAGGAAGVANVAGSAGHQPDPVLNGCVDFVDATSVGAMRIIAWDYGVGFKAERCLQIAVGQSVTWTGPLAAHPLQQAGGSMPSPIASDYGPEATSHSITFPASGLFGYVCGQHSNMQGAIRVVD